GAPGAAGPARGSPAGPAPTTAMRLAFAGAGASNSISRPALGLTRQVATRLEKIRSRHAWLQAMHTLISSARPSLALLANSGSASIGRAIDTRSASPLARSASATSGVLMRFEASDGIVHSLL